MSTRYVNESNVTYTTISDETINAKPRETSTTRVNAGHVVTSQPYEYTSSYNRSPIREYRNEANVTYTTISDNTLNVKPREFETTNVSQTHYEPKTTFTTISDNTLNVKPREFETTNVSQAHFEPKVTYTTISDNTIGAKPREFETSQVMTVVEPRIDVSEYERRIRALESELNMLRSRRPEVSERVVEKRIEVPVPVDRVVEKRVEVPIPVERVVERVVEVPVEIPVTREVQRVVEVPVEVPVERVVEKVVENRVEVPVERVVERVVEVEPKPQPRDLSSCNPFVGFGLVESEATKNHGSLPVETIYEHGPAWDAGLRLDDEIHQIGESGQPINSLNQVRDTIMREAKVGQPLRVVGTRPSTGEQYQTEVIVRTTSAKARQQGWDDVYFNTRGHQKLGQSSSLQK